MNCHSAWVGFFIVLGMKAIPILLVATGFILYYLVDFRPVGLERQFINDLITAPNEQVQEAFKNGLALGLVVAGSAWLFVSSLFREKDPKST